jgi:hypothetical protein
MDCLGHLIDDRGIHADADKMARFTDGVPQGTSTMCNVSSDLYNTWHISCQMYPLIQDRYK